MGILEDMKERVYIVGIFMRYVTYLLYFLGFYSVLSSSACSLATLLHWYKIWQTEDDEGSPASEASGSLQYHVSKEAIGKFVSFKCTPIRDDGIVGEARAFMGKDRVTPGASVFYICLEQFLWNGRHHSMSWKRSLYLLPWPGWQEMHI